ncbi:prephenate dehydrogenase [Timonella sp. A28]|uniref:prephenate dehydrogenase n=1 Tax=Timonella sp. A28 TaxID=3442640 RepID=UPI003EBE7883
MPLSTISIIGLGLIGGSLALAAKNSGVTVHAWDIDQSTRDDARNHGVQVHETLADIFSQETEIVVLAVPLKHMAETLLKVAQQVSPDVTVTDVGSVKGSVLRAAREAGLGAQFVGAHPMAGTEESGFMAAQPKLFLGATWAVTPQQNCEQQHVVQVLRMITHVFHGRALVLDADTHDQAVAHVSHVPHVLAHALLNSVQHSSIRSIAERLAAGSFRDGTRVARGNPQRNYAMIADNRAAVVPVLDNLIEDLIVLKEALGEEHSGSARAFFAGELLSREAAEQPERLVLGETWLDDVMDMGSAGRLVVHVADVESSERGRIVVDYA